MEIKKGTIIRQTKTNEDPIFKNTTDNAVLEYVVKRVNPKTYGLECIKGYYKGCGCNLRKDFKETYVDIYGTKTTWEVVR